MSVKPRALITGATGFIGRQLTKAALRRGWEVYVLVRQPDSDRARGLAAQGARLLLGDVTQRETLKAALDVARPRFLFHNAGWYEYGIPRRLQRRMWAVNVEGTEHALTLAAEAGVARTVFTSSTTALGDTGGAVEDESFERRKPWNSFYEHTKAEAHRLALRHQAAGEPVIIACPAQVIGPGDHSVFGIPARLFVRRRLPPLAWAPDGAFTFAHVDDVADGMLAVAERGRPGEIYFLGGRILTVREMIDVWEETMRRKAVWLWLPRSLALAQSAVLGPALPMLGLREFVSLEAVRSAYVSFRYTSSKAEADLGLKFRPAEQAWRETLLAEEALWLASRSRPRDTGP